MVRNKVHIWVEFKRPKAEPEPLQEHVQDEMKAQGCHIWNVDNVAKFKEILKLLTKKADGL